MMPSPTYYVLLCAVSVMTLKEVNSVVTEPYMDEPFHVPQAQAYCRGDWSVWDPKITTPPGLYIISVLLNRIFLFKCTLPMLRLTPLLALLLLPHVLSRLLAFHKRERMPAGSLVPPTADAVVITMFPVLWFFGFLYYTETPSVLLVVATVVAATEGKHWLAGLLGGLSCTFRQNNIIWVVYAYGLSQLMVMRFQPELQRPESRVRDPMALASKPRDLISIAQTFHRALPHILRSFPPYALVLVCFTAFVVWNGGIVLGDKSNHMPTLHIPQAYYFVAAATTFGWPALVSGEGGTVKLLHDVKHRMFGNASRVLATITLCALMCATVHRFTIDHPFLLSDNRHYTFYIWRRVFRLHPIVPYVLTPVYLACVWGWFLRIGRDQTLLQTLLLPICLIPTLFPTPLLELRYFIIPYILLRAQVGEVPGQGLVAEALWYGTINALTMFVFLYKERPGVGRFMY